MPDMTEIERKWLLRVMPDGVVFADAREAIIKQGYIMANGVPVRLRQEDDQFLITVKVGKGVKRPEWQEEIPQWVFAVLWPATGPGRISKTRFYIPYGILTLAIDKFHEPRVDFMFLECEFTSEEQARAFELPDWAADAIDVTDDERFTNASIALNGIPENMPQRKEG